MKVKTLRTYQTVEFQGRQDYYFIASLQKQMPDLEMWTVPQGIAIKTAKDQAIIPFANIAYFKPEEDLEEPKLKK